MNLRGSAIILVLVILVAILAIAGLSYYEARSVTPQAETVTQTNQAVSSDSNNQNGIPSVNLTVDSSAGSVSVPLGSWMSIAWTSNDVTNCTSTGWWNSWPPLNPFPSSGSSTQEWGGGGGSIYRNSDDYQVTCVAPSGAKVSSTVEISTQPVTLTIGPSGAPTFTNGYNGISNPNQVPTSAKNFLLGSFDVGVGPVGTYLTSIKVMLSKDVSSGGLKIDPASLVATVFSPGGEEWFLDPVVYGPPYDHSGGPDGDMGGGLMGLVWLPPNNTTTILIYGNVADATPGTYKAPLAITLLGGGDLNSLFRLGTLADGGDGYWLNRLISGYPIPTPAALLGSTTTIPYQTTAVGGQDIQVVR